MSKFDISKCHKDSNGHLLCQTRDGLKARILCTDRRGDYPIVALIGGMGGNYERVDTFTDCGHVSYTLNDCPNDLINIPEEPKYRAFKRHEFPKGGFVRPKGSETDWAMVIGCVNGQLKLGLFRDSDAPDWIRSECLPETHDYSTDGKTWTPAGILDSTQQ